MGGQNFISVPPGFHDQAGSCFGARVRADRRYYALITVVSSTKTPFPVVITHDKETCDHIFFPLGAIIPRLPVAFIQDVPSWRRDGMISGKRPGSSREASLPRSPSFLPL